MHFANALSLAARRQKAAVATATPTNVSVPVISGAQTNGQTLSASNGAWSQPYTSVAYQWKRDGVNIGGATSSSYTLTGTDVGTAITVAVSVTNSFGTSAAATSAATGAIATALSISGTPSTSATAGVAYSFVPTLAGGRTPRVVTAASAMPSGWSLNISTGEVSAASPVAGSVVIPALTVTDADGLTANLSGWTITVAAASGAPSLDFSQSTNSQYLPFVLAA